MPDVKKVIKGLECCTTAIGCYECPYAVGGKATNACNLLIDRDALALLKAQESRVMTLEEVHTSEICWYENSSNYGYYVGHIIKEKLGYKLRTKYLKIGSTIVHVNFDEDYNKAWRCWTSRPTDEQREKEPWDGQA